MKALAVILTALTKLSAALASGGWIGSGGELFDLNANPWFLTKHGKISYCIEVGNDFRQAHAELNVKIQRALLYLKSELNQVPTRHSGAQSVAGNEFEYASSCESTTDLIFQFGKLTAEQAAFLRDPTRYVAVAVRTHYDREKLRGRGFIYVSPDTGELAMNRTGLVDKAWELNSGALIEKAIAHELGHVFGLQHQGTPFELMSQSFLETVTSQQSHRYFLEENSFPDFTKYARGPWWSIRRKEKECHIENPSLDARIFLGLAPENDCLQLRVTYTRDDDFFIDVYSRRNGEFVYNGRLVPNSHRHELIQLGSLRLPESTGFDVVPTVAGERQTFSGFRITPQGTKGKIFFMTVAPNQIQIFGILRQYPELVVDVSLNKQ